MLLWGGPVLSWLWMEGDWSETAALRVEHAAAFALLGCVPLLAWRKAWPATIVVACWLVLTMLASTMTATVYAALVPGAYAARYLAPVALACLSLQRPRATHAEWLLRAGAAATFACHGMEALTAHAGFLDLLISGTRRMSGIDVPESSARLLLRGIGLVDVACAAAILVPRRMPAVAVWMAFWGLATASSRVVQLGWDVWPEALIRVTNGAVPLTLFLLWVGREPSHAATE